MPSIPLSQIRSFNQNVREFEDAEDEWLSCLSQDIAKNGLLHPITVRVCAQEPEWYEVIAGQRRCAACILLQWTHIDAVVVDANDSESFLISLSENMHRKPMSNRDKCAALAKCYEECEQNISKVCALTHLAPNTVRRYIQISSLPGDVIDRLDSKEDDRLTLAEAQTLAKAQEDAGESEAGSPEPTEKPPRKRPLKSDPWVYDPSGKPEAIPASLFESVHAMIARMED